MLGSALPESMRILRNLAAPRFLSGYGGKRYATQVNQTYTISLLDYARDRSPSANGLFTAAHVKRRLVLEKWGTREG